MELAADISQAQNDEEPACRPSLLVKPAWSAWESALVSARDSAISSSSRQDVGLDSDRPIVMSGHQPIVFHHGILAKLIALDEASRRTNAQAVWIIPDQDAVDPGLIRVPVGSGQSLLEQRVELLEADMVKAGVSIGSLAAAEIQEPADDRLVAITQWLDQYAGMETLAGQFGYATIEHACELLEIEVPRLIFASELFGADELYALVERMIEDPALCAQSYNNAVARHPDAGVRALVLEDDRIELPLWGCRVGEVRVAIDSLNNGSFSRDELVPRGLMMSAMARGYLADLFIHGTGGWVYDRISEDWFSNWLGIELSPMAMVTATHRLDLGFGDDETVDVPTAMWAMHHAKHTPAMVRDLETQHRKDELVLQIGRLDRKSPARHDLYRQLVGLLKEYRDEHKEKLHEFETRAQQARELEKQYELARDRTWAFVFFDTDATKRLDRSTRAVLR